MIPTIKIADPKKPGDFILINKADFDPNKHREFGAEPPKPAPAVAAPAAADEPSEDFKRPRGRPPRQ